jgi:hypothetical protein
MNLKYLRELVTRRRHQPLRYLAARSRSTQTTMGFRTMVEIPPLFRLLTLLNLEVYTSTSVGGRPTDARQKAAFWGKF